MIIVIKSRENKFREKFQNEMVYFLEFKGINGIVLIVDDESMLMKIEILP